MRIETTAARASAAIIALIGWAGLAVQLTASTSQTGSAADAIWEMLRFFTVSTNLLAAVVLTGVAFGRPAFRSGSLLALTALSMLFVGVTYVLLLRGLLELSGGAATANVILHYIMPILTPLFWLLFAPKARLEWRDPVVWAAYPVAYFAYALARGAADGKYPYPFMDIPKIGWPATLTTVAIMLIAYVLVGTIFVWLGRVMDRTQSET